MVDFLNEEQLTQRALFEPPKLDELREEVLAYGLQREAAVIEAMRGNTELSEIRLRVRQLLESQTQFGELPQKMVLVPPIGIGSHNNAEVVKQIDFSKELPDRPVLEDLLPQLENFLLSLSEDPNGYWLPPGSMEIEPNTAWILNKMQDILFNDSREIDRETRTSFRALIRALFSATFLNDNTGLDKICNKGASEQIQLIDLCDSDFRRIIQALRAVKFNDPGSPGFQLTTGPQLTLGDYIRFFRRTDPGKEHTVLREDEASNDLLNEAHTLIREAISRTLEWTLARTYVEYSREMRAFSDEDNTRLPAELAGGIFHHDEISRPSLSVLNNPQEGSLQKNFPRPMDFVNLDEILPAVIKLVCELSEDSELGEENEVGEELKNFVLEVFAFFAKALDALWWKACRDSESENTRTKNKGLRDFAALELLMQVMQTSEVYFFIQPLIDGIKDLMQNNKFYWEDLLWIEAQNQGEVFRLPQMYSNIIFQTNVLFELPKDHKLGNLGFDNMRLFLNSRPELVVGLKDGMLIEMRDVSTLDFSVLEKIGFMQALNVAAHSEFFIPKPKGDRLPVQKVKIPIELDPVPPELEIIIDRIERTRVRFISTGEDNQTIDGVYSRERILELLAELRREAEVMIFYENSFKAS